MTQRRYLALHFPCLATDRIRQKEPQLAGQPVAVWAMQGNRRLLTAADAPGTNLHIGQALADAQAMHPGVVLRDAEPEADLAFLERLALWAIQFTPTAGIDPPDGIILDVTGCAHLFGGEPALLNRICDTLVDGGVTVHGVLAGIAEAGTAMARAGRHLTIVPPGEEAAAVADLPLTPLRLPADCLAGLHRLGLQRISDLFRQPRGPLARRFGRPLMDALDGLTGDRPRSLSPVRPPPAFIAAANFLEPIVTRIAIDTALDMLLDPLCRQMAAAGEGARRVTLRAFRVDRDVQEITIGTGLPTRTPSHLRRLFAVELERLEPELGFERMSLEATATNRMAAAQKNMATTGRDEGRRSEALAELIDRLSQRLPIWRLAPAESHWPERLVARLGAFSSVPVTVPRSPIPAPVRLLKRPIPLVVLAESSGGPPLRLRLGDTVHEIAQVDGPERIEPEWWHDATGRNGRDYYRIELSSGSRLWIGRVAAFNAGQPSRWFLHGYLA